MVDDDDLPILSAVVRGGDASLIRAAKLNVHPFPEHVATSRSPRTGPSERPLGRHRTDKSHATVAYLPDTDDALAPPRPGMADGPENSRPSVDIDANCDTDSHRASHLLADVYLAIDGLAHQANAASDSPARRLRSVHGPGARQSAEQLDDTPENAIIERLVDEIVEQHARALRADLRDVLKRTLRHVDV